MEAFIRKVKEISAGRAVVLPVFGDAESMVTAALLIKRLSPKDVYFICIDHGLLRRDECRHIRDCLTELGAENIVCVKAESDFLTATAELGGRIIGPLSKIKDPAEKRYLMEDMLKRVLLQTARNICKDAAIIGMRGIGEGIALPERKALIELVPQLNIKSVLLRQPFPLPALAVRILCNDSVIAVTTEQREALCSVVERLNSGFSARLIPLRTVGTCDGVRSYKSMALICDKGTESDFNEAARISNAVHEELKFINRVVLRIDSDAPAMRCHDRSLNICREAASILRVADAIVAEELAHSSADQFFSVLLPIVSDKSKQYSLVIRAVMTEDYKTASVAMPGRDISIDSLKRASDKIKSQLGNKIDMVLYDMTSKPPAAIEFE